MPASDISDEADARLPLAAKATFILPLLGVETGVGNGVGNGVGKGVGNGVGIGVNVGKGVGNGVGNGVGVGTVVPPDVIQLPYVDT
jgi:hypothetical protein